MSSVEANRAVKEAILAKAGKQKWMPCEREQAPRGCRIVLFYIEAEEAGLFRSDSYAPESMGWEDGLHHIRLPVEDYRRSHFETLPCVKISLCSKEGEGLSLSSCCAARYLFAVTFMQRVIQSRTSPILQCEVVLSILPSHSSACVNQQ